MYLLASEIGRADETEQKQLYLFQLRQPHKEVSAQEQIQELTAGLPCICEVEILHFCEINSLASIIKWFWILFAGSY